MTRIIDISPPIHEGIAVWPGDVPYRRKVITFENAMDRHLGLEMVRVHKIDKDRSDFQRRYADGAPHIPGCYLFMWGLAERGSASEEKRPPPDAS